MPRALGLSLAARRQWTVHQRRVARAMQSMQILGTDSLRLNLEHPGRTRGVLRRGSGRADVHGSVSWAACVPRANGTRGSGVHPSMRRTCHSQPSRPASHTLSNTAAKSTSRCAPPVRAASRRREACGPISRTRCCRTSSRAAASITRRSAPDSSPSMPTGRAISGEVGLASGDVGTIKGNLSGATNRRNLAGHAGTRRVSCPHGPVGPRDPVCPGYRPRRRPPGRRHENRRNAGHAAGGRHPENHRGRDRLLPGEHGPAPAGLRRPVDRQRR